MTNQAVYNFISGSADAAPNLESTNPDFFPRNLLRSAQNRFSFKYQKRQNDNMTFVFYQVNFKMFEIDRFGNGRLGVPSDEQVKGHSISEWLFGCLQFSKKPMQTFDENQKSKR